MKSTAEVLAGKSARTIAAHPDDSIWHRTKQALGAAWLDEALLSRGEKGKNGTIVDRVAEEIAAANILGYCGVKFYGGSDKRLSEQTRIMADRIKAEAVHDRIDVFIVGLFFDHPDHVATVTATLMAAEEMATAGYAIDVLLRTDNDGGTHIAKATPESVAKTFEAMREHTQWGMSDTPHEGWILTPGDYYMDPSDWEELSLYGLTEDTAYIHITTEELASRSFLRVMQEQPTVA
jgi:LmbE family N-acetylglucosaminyl deacetylase